MKEKELDQLIQRVKDSESRRKNWQKEYNSEEWKEANKLHQLINGIPLSRGGCVDCVSDLFFQIKRNNVKIKIMKQEEKKFHLPKGTVIMLHGCQTITEHSTDREMMELLKLSPAQISKFTTYPSDWKELLGKGKEQEEESKEVEEVVEETQEEPSSDKQEDEEEVSQVDNSEREAELLDFTNGALKEFMIDNDIEIPKKANKANLVEAILKAEA